jgi:hypothetical protein
MRFVFIGCWLFVPVLLEHMVTCHVAAGLAAGSNNNTLTTSGKNPVQSTNLRHRVRIHRATNA